MDEPAVTFQGTERYQPLRLIGQGGMGVVYEALDRALGTHVALKLLPMVSPDRLLRFKREFRAVAGIHHENLVRLGDLVRFGDHWFFTMELIRGVDLLTYVRGGAGPPAQSGPRTVRWTEEDPHDSEPAADGLPPAFDEKRLRGALAQLACGLSALHATGCVHCDIKPTNVLVTAEGRVVLLDFGLASMSAVDTTLFSAGTPLYMAPEQASAGPITEAADWYSFGTLLFELLTGSLPFQGHVYEVILAKQGGRAPPVRSLLPSLPADLASLCDALLQPAPEDRPSGRDVLARLDVRANAPETSLIRVLLEEDGAQQGAREIVGREPELSQLMAAFDQVQRSGQALLVLLHGESGVGKSTLARAFMDELVQREAATGFWGCCHERELVPYKALDGVVDAIAHWLRHQPAERVDALLPARAGVLTPVFPVLARVEALARATLPDWSMDRREVRGWLFAAMRQLLANMAQQRPVIVVIDDLQWADSDSLSLLSEMLGGDPSPAVMLLGTLRTQQPTDSAPQDKLLASHIEERHLRLDNLPREAAWKLASRLIETAQLQGVDTARLAHESAGHPFFLRELVEEAAADTRASGELNLDVVLKRRIGRVGSDAKAVLQLLAVAGAPLSTQLLRAASPVDGDALAAALFELRAARLIQASGTTSAQLLEIAHERVRRSARGLLTAAQLKETHLRLGIAMERGGQPALSAVHFREADQPERAGAHYITAGQKAMEALAFVDAAQHYRAALALGRFSEEARADLLTQLADALSAAGRGQQAAAEYRQAAALCGAERAIELKRRAAEELVRSGYLDEGLNVAKEVLSDADLELAKAPFAALLRERTWLRLRGIGFRPKKPEDVDPKALARIDLCWSMSTGLVLTDHFQGAYFQARGLGLALNAGDPYRIARGLAAEAAYSASRGRRHQRRAQRLFALAQELCEQIQRPQASGTLLLMRGIAEHMNGRFGQSRELLTEATGIFRRECPGTNWELDACRQFWLESVFYLGDLRSFAATVRAGLKEAAERGAIFTSTNLRTGLANALSLIENDVARGRRDVAAAMAQWSASGFHVQHWYALIAQTQLDLYEGHGALAHRRIEARWRELEKSHLLRVSHTRIVAHHLRARAALAAAHASPGEGSRALDMAVRTARLLTQHAPRWSVALGRLIESSVAQVEGRPWDEDAMAALVGELEAANLGLFALAARSRQGDAASMAPWLSRGVAAPRAFAAMLAPGLLTPEDGG